MKAASAGKLWFPRQEAVSWDSWPHATDAPSATCVSRAAFDRGSATLEGSAHGLGLWGDTFPSIRNTFEGISNTFDLFGDTFEVIRNTFEVIQNTFDLFGDTFEINRNTFESISNTFDLFGDTFEVIPNTFDLFGDTFEGIGNTFEVFFKTCELGRGGGAVLQPSRRGSRHGAPGGRDSWACGPDAPALHFGMGCGGRISAA
jgi:hypothetical protein